MRNPSSACIPLARACSVMMIWLADMDSAMMNRMFGRVRSNVVTKLLGHACDRSGQPQGSSAPITCYGVPRLQPFRLAHSTGSPPHPDMTFHTGHLHNKTMPSRLAPTPHPYTLKRRPAPSSRRRSPTSGLGARGLGKQGCDQALQTAPNHTHTHTQRHAQLANLPNMWACVSRVKRQSPPVPS